MKLAVLSLKYSCDYRYYRFNGYHLLSLVLVTSITKIKVEV